MVTKENIKEILNCSDVYAQKMIDWANGNDDNLISLINQKLQEKAYRQPFVEV
ncbi:MULTISPECIES: hypothetical protein [Staphylococcus]|uniref:hypothetical protein n=1 Tax=Staphylococcus TaxID=1279 RepID=UPI000AD99EB3|nr:MULTISPECIES: hypothetical protein [Staphylococcus]MBM7132732.1 hypothetical protein [Staphylococcus lugdunensis]MCH8641138.1 hypothetical protein [Staphylococcus lugdunensis]MCH8644466.1 hypothetical protein [Staphylococcus lugdunensis]MDK7860033.1 hypothetical protein [Staphylococcus lugdunensis]MDK8290051.1 hypothetical protein [Staphylococcus lugdunensis]